MRNGGGVRRALVGVVAILLASACGARVTDEQRASVLGGGVGNGVVADGTGATEDGASVDGAVSEGGGGPEAGSGGAPAAGDQAGASGAGEAAAPAPAGGNGGATEIGVTADRITVGTVTTLSGPVPGLFQGAAIGAQAVAAYVNSKGGVFGRRLEVVVRDDQFDSGQHRSLVQDLSGKVLAFLGSFSTFDDAGVAAMQRAGAPDIGYGLTEPRRAFPLNFSVQPAKAGTFRTGPFLYYKRKFPEGVKAVGTIYGDIPASKGAALDSMAAARSVGWNFVYDRGYQPTETDFTADVIRMRQAGVKAFWTSAGDAKTFARIVRAMDQQNFEPEFIGFGASGYDTSFLALAGPAAEGVIVDQQLALYQGGDAAGIPEVALMNQWMQKVKPGYTPDLFATYAWTSGRMLEQALQAAGPGLTRASLLGALRKIDQFDANGLLAPAGPASKRQPACDLFMRVQNGRYVRMDPAGKGFICGGSIFTKR